MTSLGYDLYSYMSASLAIFFLGPLRMVTPAQITNIVENRNHEIPAIVVYLFIDLLLFSLSLSTFLSPVAAKVSLY